MALTDLSYGPCMVVTGCHSWVRHTRTVLSSAAEARKESMGSHATPFTSDVCPSRTATAPPVALSQTRTVLSMLQEATYLSSGDQARST